MDVVVSTLSSLVASHEGQLTLRVVAAIAAAALLGFEREKRGKAAGLRTHILVGLGAATFTMVALEVEAAVGGVVDPTRALQGVVGGIGFLGAGQIVQARGDIRGITTAAGIWLTGGVGVACGAGEFFIAGLASGAGFLTYSVIARLEREAIGGDDETQ